MPEQSDPREFDAFRETYEDEVERSIAFSGRSHDFFTTAKADCLAGIIRRELGGAAAPLRVLDVGCGHGLIHAPLRERSSVALDLTGVDVAASVIEAARATNSGVAYDTYDGTRLPYPDDSFAVAFAVCVMHHVPAERWREFVLEMVRVVRPGGLVVVFEHNPLNPLTRYVVRTCPLDEHAVLMRAGRVKALLRDAGLADVGARFILFTPLAHPLVRAIEDRLGRIPLGAQYYALGRVR